MAVFLSCTLLAALLAACTCPEDHLQRGFQSGRAQHLHTLRARVEACEPGPQREHLLRALDTALQPDNLPHLRTLPLNDLLTATLAATADRRIDDAELKPLLRRAYALNPDAPPY